MLLFLPPPCRALQVVEEEEEGSVEDEALVFVSVTLYAGPVKDVCTAGIVTADDDDAFAVYLLL